MFEGYIRKATIAKLMERGMTAQEAATFADQPWVMDIANDVAKGDTSKVPPGMKRMGPKEVQALRARVDTTGLRMDQVARADFFGANQPAAQMPLGRGEAAPPAPMRNPFAAAAQQPPASGGGFHAPVAGPVAGGIGSDFAPWLWDGAPGRKPYSLTDKDLSPAMLKKIAGEALANNPESVDAVIHNMLNRVGGEGFSGKTGSLYDVAYSPGQYTGSRTPSAAEAAMITERLKAIASGQVPDPTGGSTEYRAASYVKGQGRGKDFAQRATAGGYQNIGENVFGVMPGTKPGPYAGSGTALGTPEPIDMPMLANAGSIGDLTDLFGVPQAPSGISAIGSAGTIRANPFATASADASPMGMPLRKPTAAPPPLPTPNPFRPAPQISAMGQVGAMNGGLPPAPAYANANIPPPLPMRKPLLPGQASVGMPNQMPSAMGKAQFGGMQVNPSIGAMNGGLPPAPAFGQAQFPKVQAPSVPPMLQHLMGRSPVPPPQTMSKIPPMPMQGAFRSDNPPAALPNVGGAGLKNSFDPLGQFRGTTPSGNPTFKGRTSAALNEAAGLPLTPSMVQQNVAAGKSSAANVLTANLAHLMAAQERVHGNRYTALASMKRPVMGGFKRPTPMITPFRPPGW
jgi:hypothetical protein